MAVNFATTGDLATVRVNTDENNQHACNCASGYQARFDAYFLERHLHRLIAEEQAERQGDVAA
jgi:hypothetical protein